MGIEYTHFFLVRDLDWRPSKEAAEAVHGVLVEWGLVSGKPELTSLSVGPHGARARKVAGKQIERSGELPDELVMVYGDVLEELTPEPLARIVGQANYCGSGDLFGPSLWGIELVLGRDLKLLCAADFGVVFTDCDADVEPYEWRGHYTSWEAFPCAWRDSVPTTRVTCRHPRTGKPIKAPSSLSGLWRSALIFVHGKAHPEFLHGPKPLGGVPNRTFVRDLERAFGTRVAEAGLFG